MQSFSSFTSEQIDIDLPDDDDELEQLNEINLKRAIAPAIALSFALRKSKEVRQKLVNAKSTEELEQKLDEIADALAITDSKMNAVFSSLTNFKSALSKTNVLSIAKIVKSSQ